MKITKIQAREILDSRGNPTLEVDLELNSEFVGRAAIPSGASTGAYEAHELRDGEDRYLGKGVSKAVAGVNHEISDSLVGQVDLAQSQLDQKLIELDGTASKERLGANAILGVSLAYAWAQSRVNQEPLFKHLASSNPDFEPQLPRPMFNIMNGGKHAGWATDIQEYMVIPLRDSHSYSENLRMCVEIFQHLGKLIEDAGYSTNVGNEGGFAPAVKSNTEALEFIERAVAAAGYDLGGDVALGFDAAATEFYNEEASNYELKRDGKTLSGAEMVQWTLDLVAKYPVISLEDMLAEDDWENWALLTKELGDRVQIVGDDLLVTNTERISQAIAEQACNSLLVKVNQIGTLTEALAAMNAATTAGWTNVVSHRSGETEDVTISHIAVGTGTGQIKTGAPSRGERTAKYNELLRIAELLES